MEIAQRVDSAWDYGYAQGRRVLWWLLPNTAVLSNPAFQLILVSRFLAETGQQALAYGVLVAVVREGGGSFESALVAVAAALPPAFLGLLGGTVADSLPKRLALIIGYVFQGFACFIMPFFFGDALAAVLALIFVVNAFGQISGPSEQSIIPLVVNDHELATANSFKDLASSAGQGLGTALLAPVLVKLFGVTPVIYLAGVLLLLAAVRLIALPVARGRRRADFKPPNLSTITAVIPWLLKERAVAAMLVLSVLAGTASIVVTTLGPRFVQSALDADPADAVYVFAPSALGMLLAISFVPRAVDTIGERKVAVFGFGIATFSLFCLGLVGSIAPVVDPYNPLSELGDLAPERKMRTAAVLALPLGFGLTTVTAAVHTYLNRYVPEKLQGRMFALQSTLKNIVVIGPLLALGALATVVGVETVLLFAPVFLLVMASIFAAESYVWALEGFEPAARFRELSLFDWLRRGKPDVDTPPPAPPV
ncbi:MAG TPA: MFS transporter [Dehalococcoidia bacterium]|nr:MFS transporter [Dehalococcoidia bacterium]